MLNQYLSIVHILNELVCCSLLSFILFSEVKCSDKMTIEDSLILFNYRVMTVDSY